MASHRFRGASLLFIIIAALVFFDNRSGVQNPVVIRSNTPSKLDSFSSSSSFSLKTVGTLDTGTIQDPALRDVLTNVVRGSGGSSHGARRGNGIKKGSSSSSSSSSNKPSSAPIIRHVPSSSKNGHDGGGDVTSSTTTITDENNATVPTAEPSSSSSLQTSGNNEKRKSIGTIDPANSIPPPSSSFSFPTTTLPDIENDQRGFYLPNSSSITIITSWFLIGKSKYSFAAYDTWLRNSIASITTPMFIFTTPDQVEYLQSLRGSLPARYVLYKSIWHIPALAHYAEQYALQPEKDPDGSIHSIDLYLVWNAKPWMVAEAARHNVWQTKYFFWVDSGVFRDGRKFTDWPNNDFIDEIMSPHPCRVLMSYLGSLSIDGKFNPDPYNNLGVIGGFYGGTREAVIWFGRTFYMLHDFYLERGHFVGVDQVIFNSMVMWQSERFVLFDSRRPKPSCHPADIVRVKWFAFQHAFSRPWDKPESYSCADPSFIVPQVTREEEEETTTQVSRSSSSSSIDDSSPKKCSVQGPIFPHQTAPRAIMFPRLPHKYILTQPQVATLVELLDKAGIVKSFKNGGGMQNQGGGNRGPPVNKTWYTWEESGNEDTLVNAMIEKLGRENSGKEDEEEKEEARKEREGERG